MFTCIKKSLVADTIHSSVICVSATFLLGEVLEVFNKFTDFASLVITGTCAMQAICRPVVRRPTEAVTAVGQIPGRGSVRFADSSVTSLRKSVYSERLHGFRPSGPKSEFNNFIDYSVCSLRYLWKFVNNRSLDEFVCSKKAKLNELETIVFKEKGR